MAGLVNYKAYMIDPIPEAYRVILMFVLSSCIFGHMDFERAILCVMGMFPLLDCSMLNLFSILAMYAECKRPSNLSDLSL